MPKITAAQVRQMYELMVLARLFDEKAIALQRQGRLGTYAAVQGQEAAQIGSALALQKEDWVFPGFRESSVLMARGVPLHMILQYWAGDERGDHIPPQTNCFTVAIPVGTQTLHAVGFAWGMKLKKQKAVTIVYFGDGASSEGDVHEAMNFAGVFTVPVVFLLQNNQYAISVPRSRQTAAETLAQRAVGYGFGGIVADGNDVFAVYKATAMALEKARTGGGPTVIECITYRMGDHTTSDDAKRYRTEKELAAWRKRDPIGRLRKYMEKKKLWTKQYEEHVRAEAQKTVEQAVTEMEARPKPDPKDMFAYTFAEMPKPLQEQWEYVKRFVGEKGAK